MATLAIAPILLSATASGDLAGGEVGELAVRPPPGRQGPNLVGNSALHNRDGWDLVGDASFDSTRSRGSDGSGSFRLMTPYRADRAGSSRVLSDYIPIEEADRYTYGFYLKTASGPTYVWSHVSIHDRDRKFIRNIKSMGWGTAADGRWEECALTVEVPAEAEFVRIQVIKGEGPRARNRAWVDDFYFGHGFGLEQPPSPKAPFAGDRVRVDALGNFEVRQDGGWSAVFPMGIYADSQRDWQVYSQQGWNVIMRTDSAEQVTRAKAAVSELNPGGMFAGFSITPYTMPGGALYRDLKTLRGRLAEVLRRDGDDSLLFYHWDNERHHEQWKVPVDVIRSLRQLDAGDSGRPRRPVYALQGTYGLARTHAGRGLVDVSGTYVGGAAGVVEEAGDGFSILDRIEHQTSPASFAQFNRVVGAGDLRLRLYNSIILGARAIGYWRDCVDSDCHEDPLGVGPVDAAAWWPDVPLLRREVEALLPVIREPHWTSWAARAATEDKVRVGTRDHEGEGHLILVNQTTVPQQVTIALEGLPYEVVAAIDLSSGSPAGSIEGRTVSLTLPALGIGSGTRVVRLAGREGLESEER